MAHQHSSDANLLEQLGMLKGASSIALVEQYDWLPSDHVSLLLRMHTESDDNGFRLRRLSKEDSEVLAVLEATGLAQVVADRLGHKNWAQLTWKGQDLCRGLLSKARSLNKAAFLKGRDTATPNLDENNQ